MRKEMSSLSETARLFLNSMLSENMSLAYFLGVLFMMVEADSIPITAVKGLKYVSTIFVINVLGWFMNNLHSAAYDSFNPAIFFLTTIVGIIILKKWIGLEGDWFGLPRFIIALGPLFGSQLLIQSGGYNYAGMMTVNTAYVLGSYVLFVLIASIKEEIIVSDAAPVFKSYSTLIAAVAMLALGVVSFQLL